MDTGFSPVLLAPMMLLIANAFLLPPLTPLPFSPPSLPHGRPLSALPEILASIDSSIR